LFAGAPIAAGERVLSLGGRLVDDVTLAALLDQARVSPEGVYVDSIAVGPGRHLVLPRGSIAHFGNHSCDPTMWHDGAYDLVARRAVDTDEELTVDYGTNSAGEGFSMACRCGTSGCRSRVTSGDWRRPDLRVRYGRHWTPVLWERIRAEV
jgi:hypothetical protein